MSAFPNLPALLAKTHPACKTPILFPKCLMADTEFKKFKQTQGLLPWEFLSSFENNQ
jgi:hypothetical protein